MNSNEPMEDAIIQYLFMESDSPTIPPPLSIVSDLLEACEWVDRFQIFEDEICRGDRSEKFAEILAYCVDQQLYHLSNLSEIAHPDNIFDLVEQHDPRTFWDDGGLQVMLLSSMAEIVSGAFYLPWSGGFDVVADRSDFAAVMGRLTETPEYQWAIPVAVTAAT
jgi:hypothetical protein